MMKNLPKLLANISCERYFSPSFSFEYPKGGAVIAFEHPGEMRMWRLLVNIDGAEFIYDIKFQQIEDSIEKTARNIYKNASSASSPEDLPPYPFLLTAITGWRFRYRLLDGFSLSLVIETTILERPGADHLYKIVYAVSHEKYEQGLIVYEMLLHTFNFT